MIMLGTGAVSHHAASKDSGLAYPNRPMRILAPEPGAGNEMAARVVAQGLSALAAGIAAADMVIMMLLPPPCFFM